ncbi:hypothetical protein V6582_17810 [Agrobacterium vitis]|uniref:hypothetical protein n=1 Tax=Agrobacterium vitis TaxID=373 RepID=UPI0012E7E59E|nr:hypothetical protein [Agrobacterium vitis]MVA23187.1 hypothetical protein [Agrobacterium vitis]
MSRPWNKGTPAAHLQPIILGQFDTFNDWVDHAQRALTGFKGSVGEELKPICIDNVGRRCNVGKDFMRARDEGAFPVRYFVEMEPRAVIAVECGGEAPPVYVVEMEEAPSTALKVLGVVQVCPICDIAGCHHLRSPTPEATALPQVVIDLVIAAREFWDAHNDLSNESHALDKALEPFSARVPYENEPDAQEAAAGPTNDPL